MFDVQQTLEDPIVKPCLAQLVAVEDRPDTLPALLEEVVQRLGRLFAVELLDRVHDARRPVDAEAALARAHAEAEGAADVVEVGRAASHELLFEPPATDQLAFADELVVGHRALAPAQPRADLVVRAVVAARRLE